MAEFLTIGLGKTGSKLSDSLYGQLSDEMQRAEGAHEAFFHLPLNEPRRISLDYRVSDPASVHLHYRDMLDEDEFSKSLQSELERCDQPRTFLLLYNSCDACGSGSSVRVLEELSALAPKIDRCGLAILPSDNQPLSTVDIYNSVLNLAETSLLFDSAQVVDYDALYRVLLNQMPPEQQTQDVMDQLAVKPIVNFTSLQRYQPKDDTSSEHVTTLASLTSPLACGGGSPFYVAGCYPPVNVPHSSAGPSGAKGGGGVGKTLTWRQVCWSLFNPDHMTLSGLSRREENKDGRNSTHGKYITSCTVFRGSKDAAEPPSIPAIMSQMQLIERHTAPALVRQWKSSLPRRIHSYISDSEACLVPNVTFAGNTSELGTRFTDLSQLANKGLRANAWISKEDMPREMVENAIDRLINVAQIYQKCQERIEQKTIKPVSFLWELA